MKRGVCWMVAALCACCAAAQNLFENGGFEEVAAGKAWPKHWPGGGATYEQEDGNRFLRLASQGTEKLALFFYTKVAVPEGYRFLELSFRTRYADVRRGKEAWHDARFMMNFIDGAGQKSGASPVAFTGTSDGWVEVRHRMPIPRGAVGIEVMPCHFNTAGGTFDIDDLVLVAVEPVAETGAPMTAEATLTVAGNRLRNRRGEEVWLQGLAIPSLEWSAEGENLSASFKAAIHDWRANCIRLAVKSTYWFGKGERQPADGGKAYRERVDGLISYASANGCYVVLDLHEYKAPTAAHAAFWKDAATRYANDPAVLFDILNEPHGISWREWRDGGRLAGATRGGVVDENDEAREVTVSIGMQKLVDSIRAAGAKNIIIAGGLDWAYDLSGIVDGFALEERGGNGIMYAAHIYPWKSDWNGKVLAAAKRHPVFVGEVGCQSAPMPFEKVAQDPYAWAPDMLAFIQRHRLNWTAWSFHPSAAPCVIADWDYTPTPYWGAFVRAALRGAVFAGGRER